LNYLSINDQGATALREILRLYADANDVIALKQIDGIQAVTSEPIVRQLATEGPITFGRGLEVALTLEEDSFEGIGVYLIGAVLERFFAKYTSINSFTETVLHTDQRQEVARWRMRTGRRHTF
jgi:type VI secretion system protein ImpG